MNLTVLDIFLLVIVVVACGVAVYRRLLRQLMSLVVLYVATAVAGLFYRLAARFFTAIAGRNMRPLETLMFLVLLLVTVVALEVMLRRGFPDVRLPKLGFLDYLLALPAGAIYGLIVASLLLAALAYLSAGQGAAYQAAALREPLGQFLYVYLVAHSLWFSYPPPLLAVALP